MTDITERLRRVERIGMTVDVAMLVEAADEIDRLRTALAQPAIDGFGGNLDSAFDAPAPAPVVPDGWVIVPTHLTVDQLETFVGHGLCCGFDPITDAVIDAGHKWARLLDRIAAAPGSAPAVPAVREPLADAQLVDALCNTLGIYHFRQAFVAGARYAEAHHGIGTTGGGNG